MDNTIYVNTFTTLTDYKTNHVLKVPLESFITYCIYKCLSTDQFFLQFVTKEEPCKEATVEFFEEGLQLIDSSKVSWQATLCLYPVAVSGDTIITGLCAVARYMCKFKNSISTKEHDEGLLSFRKGCLQAPNEVSIWTKFCEVDIVKTVSEVVSDTNIRQVPINLVRFENHLSKPVKLHNVYKIARDMKKLELKNATDEEKLCKDLKEEAVQNRIPKPRKWKSNLSKELESICLTNVDKLDLQHQFAEGPFLTLADLVLLPSFHIIIKTLGETIFEKKLPLSLKWYQNAVIIPELEKLRNIFSNLIIDQKTLFDLSVPETDNVSLYKCDPKRHNPKKRLFTKEEDIELALCNIINGMQLNATSNNMNERIDWDKIPSGANPKAGHLPDKRMQRKCEQLENLAIASLEIVKDGDLIVDFCSGSGHLGILVAHLLPECIIILLENKEQSLLRARKRVHEMGLKNVYFFQCNLDFFVGNFNIGLALHACGVASDLVLEKCLKANAKFVICPCCYGSLHATDRINYPRSALFAKSLSIDQYLCIGHAADQTHEEHPLTVRGARCMAVIDSDRAHFAEEFGYKVNLFRLYPLSCTPKNNLLVGIPG